MSAAELPGPIDPMETQDLNTLQTALRNAVQTEDYALAAKIRDRVASFGGGSGRKDWYELGLPFWLADRAERLGYMYPTAVQAAAVAELLRGSDVLIQAQTGSGKTLAFLLPCLAQLSPSLFSVEILRSQMGPTSLQPLALFLVPTRELGAQLALLIWRLLGGNDSERTPGDETNIFTYEGPRGVKVMGILDEADVERCRTDIEGGGLLEGVQFLVGVPRHVAQVMDNGNLPSELLRYIAVDELDLCLTQDNESVQKLLKIPEECNHQRQVALAGATLPDNTFQECLDRGWISYQPVRVGDLAPDKMQSALPPALTHRRLSLHVSDGQCCHFRSLFVIFCHFWLLLVTWVTDGYF